MFCDKIINFNFYLILFFPIALITGPLISDFIVVLSSLLFCYYFKFYHLKIFENKLILILILLWIASIISSIFSDDIFFSIKSSLFYIRVIIFSLVVYLILKVKEKKLPKVFNILLFIFLVLFIDSIFQRFFGYNLIGLPLLDNVRISSFFGDELILGSYLVKLYPILIALLYLIKSKKFFLYFSLISIITFISVFLSAEKAALVIFIIEFVSLIFLINKNFKIKFLFIFSMILLFFFMFFSFPKIKTRIYDQLISNSENFKYIYSRVHTEHYISGYKMFTDYPSIGIGPKMYRKFCSKPEYISEFSCATHPHNYSIQLLAETGLLGFSLFICFYSILLKNFVKLILQNKTNKYKFPLYSLLLLNLINFMPLFPSGNFYNNWVSIFYSFSFGIYLYFNEKYEENI